MSTDRELLELAAKAAAYEAGVRDDKREWARALIDEEGR